MTKEKFGRECKICTRPFTIFRWCPGRGMRFKKTEVCQTCSKLKNVCQTCLLDLEYGLPTEVRDAALAIKDQMPKSDVNKEFFTQNKEKQLETVQGVKHAITGKAPNEMLLKLARTTPYYRRNRPHICSFWVKGECRRGEECPYRHDKPTDPDDPLADQNLKDRYYGVNDPVADKLLRRAKEIPKLDPPSDKSVTSLFVGGLDDEIDEKAIRSHFYQFGEIRSVSMVARQKCCFVQYTTRAAAESAAEKSFMKLLIKGRRLNVRWGKSQTPVDVPKIEHPSASKPEFQPVPGLPARLPAPVDYLGLNMPMAMPFFHPIPPPPCLMPGMFPVLAPMQMMAPRPIHYPSQDPARMGTDLEG